MAYNLWKFVPFLIPLSSILLIYLVPPVDSGSGYDYSADPFDPHPRFIVQNGHLLVLSGRNKNVVFRSMGSGRITVNGDDIAQMQQGNQPQISGNDVVPGDVITARLNLVEQRFQNKLDQLKQELNATAIQQQSSLIKRQRRRIRNIFRRLSKLEKLLNKNECETNPCMHGGTCEDGFNRYFCQCPEGYTGKSCEQDIDECSRYQGTELGCQNGGTCLNTFGSYHCLCPSNYQGVRCTVEFNDCRNVSDVDICGNGLCLNLPRAQNSVARYRCVCYQGFTRSDKTRESAPCDQDVDECELGIHHCSKNPAVTCVNIRKGYNCGPCPAGYSGNGFNCVPTDMCLVNNGGCSQSPQVSCFNLDGKVTCGSCPPGYVGDGTVCSPIDGDVCSANNGGCSPNARCQSNIGISATYRSCVCNDGYVGPGFGINGCRPQALGQSCNPNPCQNDGYCMTINQRIVCQCTAGFGGRFCDKPTNSCTNNPCQHNGVCYQTSSMTYSCICTNEYMGQNCEQPRSSCGGVLDSETGILSYPIDNGTQYVNNATCIWIIRNSQAIGKVLNVTFTRFKVESSARCMFDYLEIFDGDSREHRKIGQFCGDQLPNKNGIIITSFNSIYLKFNADPSVNLEGFSLNWVTTDPVCGGTIINQTHGVIQSPGYPHHYPANLDCYWDLVADYGKRFQFVFSHLDIEPHFNCSFDFLEFREGFSMTDKSNIIARFCNWTASQVNPVPEPITTSGSFANLHFHSDAGAYGQGFQLIFSQVAGVCGGLLTSPSGTFRPPSSTYTSPLTGRTMLVYQNNIVCDWLIRVMPGERISLRFLYFMLESDNVANRNRNTTINCMFDYVEIFDGETYESPLRARLCGRTIPHEIISTGRYLRVKFRSDMSVSLRGFVAHYTALCGEQIDNAMEGQVQSPNYPAPLISAKNCTYILTAPLGYVIRFEIEKMEIEFDPRCLFDYIKVGDQRYCGTNPPAPFYSLGNELRINYVNDDSKPSRGFVGRYRAIELGCGGVLNQGDPVVSISPSLLKDSLPISQCFWEVRANKGSIVMVKFFHTLAEGNIVETSITQDNRKAFYQNNQDCFQSSRYIMVNDSDGSLIKKFCLDELPPAITSSGRKLLITYVFKPPQAEAVLVPIGNVSSNTTTSATTTLGARTTVLTSTSNYIQNYYGFISTQQSFDFYANYFFIPSRNYCDRNIFASSGFIQSPRFPRRYPANSNCTWVVHVENGKQIELKVESFQVELHNDITAKCFDYLEIRNGRRPDSPLIGRFCGNGPLPQIVSHSNYLFFRFISDASMQTNGFKIAYNTLSSGCGGVLSAESGTIESPDYPNHYYSNANCEWKIRVSEGSSIVLHILALDIEQPINDVCAYDFVELFDGDSDGAKSLGRFCYDISTVSNSIITASGNQLFIRFVTDASINHGGFKLSYRTECNRTISGRYGIIESPNYPEAHPHNLKCNWHILAPFGNNLTLSFTSLSLEASIDCVFDHINISRVNRNRQLSLSKVNFIGDPTYPYNTSLVRQLCGNFTSNLPAPFQIDDNEIIIRFVSDESRSIESKFRLEWASVGCGGQFINRPSGVLQSPNFPNPYPSQLECLWHIQAPVGHRIDLTIETIDLEFSKSCLFDYLKVYGGPDENAPMLAHLCNQESNLRLSSVGNFMTIKMYSDISTTGRGFNASFTTDQTGCGGTFVTDSGTIISPNYGNGNSYEPNSDCSYKIEVNGNYEVELSVNELDIPDSSDCHDNYLAIYDAPDDSSEQKLVRKLCGNLKDLNSSLVQSTDSSLYLRFKADGTHSGRGFNATYRKVCGKTIMLSDLESYREITSSNYPHLQHRDEKCHYIFRAENPANHITLRFAYLNSINVMFGANSFQMTNSCQASYIDIYEGDQMLAHKRKERICQLSIGTSIVSDGDTMTLLSNWAIFRAYVSALKSFCGGDFNSNEGYISNPGYPNSYPMNIECIWVIKASPGNRYSLRFDDFDLEESEFCNNDYVEIRQQNSSGPLVGDGRLCGTGKIPLVDVGFNGDIWIKFKTDDANVAKGFMLAFEIASNVMISGNEGFISSPGYPNGFHFDNRSITYSIVVPHDHVIKLDFVEFSLVGDNLFMSCPVHLSVYDGLIDFSQMTDLISEFTNPTHQHTLLPNPTITYCGKRIPLPFVSKGNALTMVFKANYYLYYHNKFMLKWSAVNSSDTSSLITTSTDGIPGDVNSTFSIFVDHGQRFNLINQNYSDYGRDIDWYFQTKSSMHFNISSALVSFHPSTSCWYNKMSLFTWIETRQSWNLLRTLCNGFAGKFEVPGTNMVRLHLQHAKLTDAAVIVPKYNLTFFPICGGNFTDSSGEISGQVDLDGISNSCQWLVKVREGRTIQFTVEFVAIGYLSQTICTRENLEIRNGHFSDSPLLVQQLCGHNSTTFDLPKTSSNVAYVIYHTIVTIRKQPNDFKLLYREVGLECGGEVVIHSPTESVVIQSPEYPESPSHDLTCEWIVRGPLDYGLQLMFTPEKWYNRVLNAAFNFLFDRVNCDIKNSYLEIYNGGSTLAALIDTFCMPPYNLNTITVHNHITLIRYVLNKRDFHSKFSLTVKVDNCNREYFVGSLSMMNTDYYEFPLPAGSRQSLRTIQSQGTVCTLRLKTQPNYYIVANVSSINLRGQNCTSGDIVDFSDAKDSLIPFEHLCPPRNDSNAELSIPSLNNEMFVTYKRINYQEESDDQNQSPQTRNNKNNRIGIKFTAEIKFKKCSRFINARLYPNGLIQTPSFPNAVRRRVFCNWVIIGEPGTRIELFFERFNLGEKTPTTAVTSGGGGGRNKTILCKSRLAVLRNVASFRKFANFYGCSDTPPTNLYSLSHTMWLNMYANELEEREGFVILYRTINDNKSCSALLDSNRGPLITSDFYNLNNTGHVGCAWEMKLDSNQSGTFLLDTFDVNGDCSNASLSTLYFTSADHYSFRSFVCISAQNAPQTKGLKYVVPIYHLIDETKNPLIILNFNRTQSGKSRGLRGEYFVQNCGGFFEDFEGEFRSINYPSSYPDDTFCNWYFHLANTNGQAFTGYRLTFVEFDISDNCDQDYFFIKSQFDTQQGVDKICKRDGLPHPIYITHDLVVSFVSSRNMSTKSGGILPAGSNSNRKFLFKIEKTTDGCGGQLITPKGYFQSPNYATNISDSFTINHQYSPNIECVWYIRSVTDFHLVFEFNSRFDLEESTNCTNDFVLFEERISRFENDRTIDQWIPIRRLCGHRTPDQISSSTNLIRVTFRTNGKIVGDGFRVDYRQECGGMFQDESGIINSPHYHSEGSYGNELTCVYQIKRSPKEYIRLEFEDFDLEQHVRCLFDSVEIYLGDHTNKTTVRYGPYCGSVLPPALSSHELITVVFKSDTFITRRGFKFRYNVTRCGGEITDSGGLIISPDMMKEYESCVWKITVPNNRSVVSVRIVELELANTFCRFECCNYIRIYDGQSSFHDSNSLAYICSNNHEDLTFKSSTNVMSIRFYRGYLDSSSGVSPSFKIVYEESSGPEDGCGGTIVGGASSGVITSPDIDGDSNYEPNLNCIWSITVSNTLSELISVEFERFDLEEVDSNGSCTNDYVSIYDGSTLHAPTLASVCGRIMIPDKIISTAPTLLIQFVTNENVTGHGFRLHYTIINRTCGSMLHATEDLQLLTSPNYPDGYSVPEQCSWNFQPSMNYLHYRMPTILTITDLDLNCSRGDYLQIIESTMSTYDMVRFNPITLCSSGTPIKIITTNRLGLVMKANTVPVFGGVAYDNQQFINQSSSASSSKAITSGKTTTNRGFSLTYHISLCNETVDGPDNGYLLSRNYPKVTSIYRDLLCVINITVPRGQQISLYFNEFSFYQCHYSNMTIYEGNSTRARATFCDMVTPPNPFFSKSNQLSIVVSASRVKLQPPQQMEPNSRFNKILYSLTYSSTPESLDTPGCGGNLTGYRGSFTSPNYPYPFNNNQLCRWLITTGGYHTVTLTLDFFLLSPNCANNFLAVYDGEDDIEENKLTTFCGNDKPAPITSRSGSMVVKLYSTFSNYEPGFRASYKTNTKENSIKGRVITKQTFKFYRSSQVYTDV